MPKSSRGWSHSARFTELEVMERFQIDPFRWEALKETEEGQYFLAELVEYVIEKGEMLAYERHQQEEEFESKRRGKSHSL